MDEEERRRREEERARKVREAMAKLRSNWKGSMSAGALGNTHTHAPPSRSASTFTADLRRREEEEQRRRMEEKAKREEEERRRGMEEQLRREAEMQRKEIAERIRREEEEKMRKEIAEQLRRDAAQNQALRDTGPTKEVDVDANGRVAGVDEVEESKPVAEELGDAKEEEVVPEVEEDAMAREEMKRQEEQKQEEETRRKEDEERRQEEEKRREEAEVQARLAEVRRQEEDERRRQDEQKEEELKRRDEERKAIEEQRKREEEECKRKEAEKRRQEEEADRLRMEEEAAARRKREEEEAEKRKIREEERAEERRRKEEEKAEERRRKEEEEAEERRRKEEEERERRRRLEEEAEERRRREEEEAEERRRREEEEAEERRRREEEEAEERRRREEEEAEERRRREEEEAEERRRREEEEAEERRRREEEEAEERRRREEEEAEERRRIEEEEEEARIRREEEEAERRQREAEEEAKRLEMRKEKEEKRTSAESFELEGLLSRWASRQGAHNARHSRVMLVGTGVHTHLLPLVALAQQLRLLQFDVALATHVTTWVRCSQLTGSVEGIRFFALEGDPEMALRSKQFQKALEDGKGQKFIEGIPNVFMQQNLELLHKHIARFGAEMIVTLAPLLNACNALGQRYQLPIMCVDLEPFYPTSAFASPYSRASSLLSSFVTKGGQKEVLGPSTSLVQSLRTLLHLPEQPFEYDVATYLEAYSTTVVPKPADWPDHVCHSSGFLQPIPTPIEPDEELLAFLLSAEHVVFLYYTFPAPSDPLAFAAMLATAASRCSCKVVLCAPWTGHVQRMMEKNASLVMDEWDGMPADPVGSGGSGSDSDRSTRTTNTSDVAVTHTSDWEDDVFMRHVYMREDVPLSWTMRRCAAVIHHGSASMTAMAMFAGAPSLIFPVGSSDYFWFQKCSEAGIGPRKAIPWSQMNEKTLVQQLSDVLTQEVRAAATLLATKLKMEERKSAFTASDRVYLHWKKNRHRGVFCDWVDPSNSAKCGLCRKKWGFMARKYNCRSCGGVFCTSHVGYREIPNYKGAQTVCEQCNARWNTAKFYRPDFAAIDADTEQNALDEFDTPVREVAEAVEAVQSDALLPDTEGAVTVARHDEAAEHEEEEREERIEVDSEEAETASADEVRRDMSASSTEKRDSSDAEVERSLTAKDVLPTVEDIDDAAQLAALEAEAEEELRLVREEEEKKLEERRKIEEEAMKVQRAKEAQEREEQERKQAERDRKAEEIRKKRQAEQEERERKMEEERKIREEEEAERARLAEEERIRQEEINRQKEEERRQRALEEAEQRRKEAEQRRIAAEEQQKRDEEERRIREEQEAEERERRRKEEEEAERIRQEEEEAERQRREEEERLRREEEERQLELLRQRQEAIDELYAAEEEWYELELMRLEEDTTVRDGLLSKLRAEENRKRREEEERRRIEEAERMERERQERLERLALECKEKEEALVLRGEDVLTQHKLLQDLEEQDRELQQTEWRMRLEKAAAEYEQLKRDARETELDRRERIRRAREQRQAEEEERRRREEEARRRRERDEEERQRREEAELAELTRADQQRARKKEEELSRVEEEENERLRVREEQLQQIEKMKRDRALTVQENRAKIEDLYRLDDEDERMQLLLDEMARQDAELVRYEEELARRVRNLEQSIRLKQAAIKQQKTGQGDDDGSPQPQLRQKPNSSATLVSLTDVERRELEKRSARATAPPATRAASPPATPPSENAGTITSFADLPVESRFEPSKGEARSQPSVRTTIPGSGGVSASASGGAVVRKPSVDDAVDAQRAAFLDKRKRPREPDRDLSELVRGLFYEVSVVAAKTVACAFLVESLDKAAHGKQLSAVGDLGDISARLRLGVDVRDRRYFLKTFKRCFLGDEACTWLKRNLGLRSRVESARIGQHMLEQYVSQLCAEWCSVGGIRKHVCRGKAVLILNRGYIRHVEGKVPFMNEKHLYVFTR